MSNKKIIKGTMVLGVAGLISKFLGIFLKIPLQRLIHDDGMGIFSLPFPIYTIMLSISIIGLPAAISKMISEKMALGDYRGATRVFKISFYIIIGLGLLSSCLLFYGVAYMITLLDWPEQTYHCIKALAPAPFFVSIMSAFRGYFQGMQIMTPTALSQIVEQLGRVIIGISLAYIYIGKGIGHAAAGASFGATGGAFLGALLLLFYYLTQGKSLGDASPYTYTRQGNDTIIIIKNLVCIAIPISCGAILSSVMVLVDSIIVPGRLLGAGYTLEGATILYGRLTGKAITLTNVPLSFSTAIAASLVPAISEANSKGNTKELKKRIQTGIKITTLIALPSAIGIYILSNPIIHLLWGSKEAGGDILKVLAGNILFIAIAQTLTAILQGLNKAFVPVKNLFLGVIVKIIVSYFLLATHLNIVGAVVGSICGYIIVVILNYREVKKSISLTIPLKNVVLKPIFATIIMSIIVVFTFDYGLVILQHENLATIIAIFFGIFSYGGTTFLMGVDY